MIFTLISFSTFDYYKTQNYHHNIAFQQAENIRNILMATRRVYHQQFIKSNIPLNEKTVGFLPAHALNEISIDLKNWDSTSYSFNNVSDRPRNFNQKADSLEQSIMNTFRNTPSKKFFFKKIEGDKSFYQYARPIWIEEYCLKCHGEKSMAPPTIQKMYATAYDYKVGDLRGLLSIKIDASLIDGQVEEKISNDILAHISLVILLILITVIIFHYYFNKPLAILSKGVSLFRKGEYLTKISVKGKEFSVLGDSMNSMADQINQAHIEQLNNNNTLQLRVNEQTQQLRKEIEHHKNTETLLRHAINETKNANNAKSQFLANVSHEIRTPMNAILGFSELLDKQVVHPKEKKYTQLIRGSGKLLLTLINGILDLSKIEAGKLSLEFKPVNIKNSLNEIQNMFRDATKEKGIAFSVSIDPTVPQRLILDELRLQQILINIINNAIKFTTNGSITVMVSSQETTASPTMLDLTFSVKDTGMGINNDEINSIFQPFTQQTSQNHALYGGTGLGLSIVKSLVELMNGEVCVVSEPDKGSTFTVVLKNINAGLIQEEPSPLTQNRSSSHALKKVTILVVDDLDINRFLIQEFLEELPVTIIEAENGQEAIDMVQSSNPDMILMDMKMPVMDGQTATKIIKEMDDYKHIPIIALTADIMKHNEKWLLELCDGVIKKPINQLSLINEIKKRLFN